MRLWGKRSDIPAGKRLFEVTIHYNGRTRHGISATQLRSGIVAGRGTKSLHQNGFLSGYLPGNACLRHSFCDSVNVPQPMAKVNPPGAKNTENTGFFLAKSEINNILFYVNVSKWKHNPLWSYCTINRIFWMNVYIIRIMKYMKKFCKSALPKKKLDFFRNNVIIHSDMQM